MVSQYVKLPQLKKILDVTEQPCEETLSQIRNLVDDSGSSLTLTGGENGSAPGVAPGTTVENGNFASYEKILKLIKNSNDKKVALSLLQEISKSDHLSWDPETLEIIISGEPVKYTNIALLVRKIVSVGPTTLPIGFVLFLDSLRKIKAPYTLLRNGDAVSVLDTLSRIGGTLEPATETSVENKENTDNVDNEMITESHGQKRDREDSESEGLPENQSKKLRKDNDEGEETVPKRDFNVPSDRLKKLRRSPRLKKSISDAWDSMNNDRKTRKKRS